MSMLPDTVMSPAERRYRFLPPWAWLALIGFLMLLGGVLGALVENYRMVCHVDRNAFDAHTTICSDGEAYALIPLTTDVRVLERRLIECRMKLDGGL
jgi:hypothetical protein